MNDKERRLKKIEERLRSTDEAGVDRKPEKKKPLKTNTDAITKLVVIGIVSIALILVLATIYVAILTNTKGNDTKTSASTEESVTSTSEMEVDDVKQYNRSVAVVKYENMEEKRMVIYDIDEFKTISLDVDGDTDLKDAYGTDIALSQFDVGDIVEVKYEKDTNVPKYIKITGSAWDRKNVSDVEINENEKTIKVKNDVYKYTDDLVRLEGGEAFDLSSLSADDEVSLKGYANVVWSIKVEGRHGSIKLINSSLFLGGTLEILGHVSKDVVANMTVSLPAGTYSISVTKEGMPPVLKRIVVEESKETILDLGEVQVKVGEVDFITEQDGVKVFVDDKQIDVGDKQVLDFGKYKIRAEKEGFETWKGELVVKQAYMRYKVDLEQKQTYIHFNEPEGAEVYFDGELVGVIPTKTVFSSGSHTVQLRRDGYRTSKTFNCLWGEDDKDKYLILPALVPLQTTSEKNDITLDPEESTTAKEEVKDIGDDVYGK